jgi:serine/threonine-protein kinase
MHFMDDPSPQDALIGLKLGEYELRQRIGVGGMGLVYDGIQPLIGKRVAVKVLRPELAAAEEQVARLLAEARAVNAIRHRGIVDIFGFGQVPDGRQYIIMEYLEGIALDAHLAERGRLSVTEALDILDEVLSALGAAHGAGVVHRDLKPSNIFLVQQPDGSRYVKLLDFGLAKMGLPTGRTAQTRTDMVVGTPEYMAPEQARGQPVGPMTDLYALGVVAFEMVTGRLPFTGTSPVDLLMKHVDARPPRPSEFVPELSPALDAFILQMLTKDPEARPGSAESLRRQLQRLRETLTQAVAPPAPPKPTAPEPIVQAHPEPPRPPAQPVSPPKVASEPSTDVVGPGARWPLRRLLPVALGGTALVAVVGVVLALREPPPAPPPQVNVTPPAPTQPQTPPPTQPAQQNTAQVPTVPSNPTPQPPVAAPQNPPGGTESTDHVETPPLTGTKDKPRVTSAPARATLLKRIEKMEDQALALQNTGKLRSPATFKMLNEMRDNVETATPEQRKKLALELDSFQNVFLKPR